MADKSHIEWTDATWNPVTGCSVVSPGCTHCYAMKLAGGRLRNHPSRAGLTTESKNGPVWNGAVRFNESWLLQPLRWKRPRMIFVCAHGDLFHEDVPDEWIDRVFAVMALAPQHTFQVLTKRGARMREYFAAGNRQLHIGQAGAGLGDLWFDGWTKSWPLRNVWLGVSTERQQEANQRISDLQATPAAVRFLSVEPMLGRVDLCEALGMWWNQRQGCFEANGSRGFNRNPNNHAETAIDWVIVGGESGNGARPMHSDWARSLRDQCQAAGVPFFFKQWGNIAPLKSALPVYEGGSLTAWPDGRIGEGHADTHGGPGCQLFLGTKGITGRLLDGVEHNAMPVRS